MSGKPCVKCGKTAYPLEAITAQDKTYHKLCFKCSTCQISLNLKNYKTFQGEIYCVTHTPTVKGGPVTLDTVAMKSATSVPKKGVISGVHKADPRVAPTQSQDFTVNQAADQSTENNPEESGIAYEAHSADQSTENNPEESGIVYDQVNPDQSTGYEEEQQYEDQ
eukprot:CAMPEP_0168547286 /NCGR_PEP_ID=MMETSP0413-20121227/3953_1 /TAXON_ID=136452 /ORGANISM="Filamoeba nolandi, Strain NC-AS-23-1" /LENGTH=164 /DNA_ID=CAMNT_0008577525 /DNA_START=83 /DNA_END=577 /DNA_ORIENTATION=+